MAFKLINISKNLSMRRGGSGDGSKVFESDGEEEEKVEKQIRNHTTMEVGRGYERSGKHKKSQVTKKDKKKKKKHRAQTEMNKI